MLRHVGIVQIDGHMRPVLMIAMECYPLHGANEWQDHITISYRYVSLHRRLRTEELTYPAREALDTRVETKHHHQDQDEGFVPAKYTSRDGCSMFYFIRHGTRVNKNYQFSTTINIFTPVV